MNNNRLTTQEYWQHESEATDFQKHEVGHSLNLFIEKYIPKTITGSVLEIGSYPGPFLCTFGDLGYTLNGIDFNIDNDFGLPNWLFKQGYKVEDFFVCDFYNYSAEKKFDVVCSFGFIEHFVNYEEVIVRHADYVKKGGYLMITTPNFRGFVQKKLHEIFDKKNLAIHNLESMQPTLWAENLQKCGFEILYHGHFGGFWFWRGVEKLSFFKRNILWLVVRIIPRLRRLLKFDHSLFSAYCGIVARKI